MATPSAPTFLLTPLDLPQGCVWGSQGRWSSHLGGPWLRHEGTPMEPDSVIQPGLQSEQQLTVPGCNCHRQVTALSPRQLFGASVFRAGQVPVAGTAG